MISKTYLQTHVPCSIKYSSKTENILSVHQEMNGKKKYSMHMWVNIILPSKEE